MSPPACPGKFEAETASITLRTGQTATVFFKLTNTAARPTAGTAMYNVSPDVSGAYFNKLECFCFDEKKLGPNESMDVPLVFFLDPALEKDESMARVDSFHSVLHVLRLQSVCRCECRRGEGQGEIIKFGVGAARPMLREAA